MQESLIYNSSDVLPRASTRARIMAARRGASAADTAAGFIRWLAVWRCAVGILLKYRARGAAPKAVITRGAVPDELFYGLRGVLRIPAELFTAEDGEECVTELIVPVKDAPKYRPSGGFASADELIGAIRFVERSCEVRFDWDAFTERCGRRARAARRISSFAGELCARLGRADGAAPREILENIAAQLRGDT